MNMVTIRQYAKDQNVSYEAVRKQIVRYAEDLEGHIVKRGRTQYLDEWAVTFLSERRRENPVILMGQEKSEEIEKLRQQVEALKIQLLTAQGELLTAQGRIIELQEEGRLMIEAKSKYDGLLEAHTQQEERLRKAEDRVTTSEVELSEAKTRIEDLQRERDEAQREAQSFKKSIFGFYRKR